MNLKQLMKIRAERLEAFERNFSQMSFESEKDKKLYYEASMKGMTEFFQDALIVILNDEPEISEKKRIA